MVNIAELKVELVRHNMSVEQLAEASNINRSRLYRRISSPDEFTIGEASAICNALGISQERATDIFFAQNVA